MKTFKICGAIVFLLIPSMAFSDGMPDEPARKPKAVKAEPQVQPPPPPPPVERAPVEPVAAPAEEPCAWMLRLSGGVTTWFFDEESTLPGAAMSLDTWRTDYPINFHVGVEGRHMYLGQDAAEFAKEFEDKTTKITFIRIPFALEYMYPVAASTTWYLGGGPDIIHTANDIGDTNVGMHLGTRLHYGFTENWGASLEAGYMWGDVDGQGKDVELDNAYVTPAIAYTF